MRYLVLLAFGFSGAAALIYEVAWTREVALVLGSTTYALSTMLSAFMAGLALGGFVGGRLADVSERPVFHFGLIEIGIGTCGLVTVPVIRALSPYYYNMYAALNLEPVVFMITQFLVCFLVMLLPTVLMGVTFPVVSKVSTDERGKIGSGIGNAYSANTFGAIIGSLAAGFLLIPAFGIKYAVIIAAALNVVTGLSMLVLSRKWRPGFFSIFLLPIIVIALIAALNYRETGRVPNYYTVGKILDYQLAHGGPSQVQAINFFGPAKQSDTYGMKSFEQEAQLLFLRDYAEGRVKLWRDRDGYLNMQVGGKNEGTSREDIANARMLTYLPIAAHPHPKSFLVIGLGVGVTLSAARESMADVSLAEINPGVIEAMRLFGQKGLLDGIDISINDARNYLALTQKKFDVISSEPSYPTDPGTGNLFTKEAYELAASRLNPGGIYCQWLPYYVLSDADVTMMLKTFGSVFQNIYLWKIPITHDLIMLGSSAPFAFGAEEMFKRAQQLNIHPEQAEVVLSKSPDQVREIIAANDALPFNTDDKPLLEFHAAMNFITHNSGVLSGHLSNAPQTH